MFHIVKCHHGIGIDNNVGGEDCSKLCRPLSLTEHCKLSHLLIKKKKHLNWWEKQQHKYWGYIYGYALPVVVPSRGSIFPAFSLCCSAVRRKPKKNKRWSEELWCRFNLRVTALLYVFLSPVTEPQFSMWAKWTYLHLHLYKWNVMLIY